MGVRMERQSISMDITKFDKITHFVFDVDGVFTNSQLLITEEGNLLRTMNVRDGYAVKVALQQGIKMAIITGGSSQGVSKRLKALGIHEVYSGVWDKGSVFSKILEDENITQDQVLYVGDDIMDLPCLKAAGIGVCPKDGAIEAIEVADMITESNGGEGCVREVIQKVLEYQSKWVPLKS